MTDSRKQAQIEATLRSLGSPDRAINEKRYLKSDLQFLGVRKPDIRSVVADVLKQDPDLDRHALVALVEALWATPVFEHRMASVILLDRRSDLLEAADIDLVERLLRESRTWAFVDELAVKVVGALVERNPELGSTLDRWATDVDFWIRRSSMLTLLRPLRRGEGDFDRFGRYADRLLEEKEFFIRKAIGWVLRETSKKRPDLVFAWIKPRARRASGVTMREAVRYLGDERSRQLMADYKSARS